MVLTVHIKEGEPIDRGLKRFKRKCDKVGIKKMVRANRYFQKKSSLRRKSRLRTAYIQRKRGQQDQD